jgi:gas vesicle protein
MNPQTQEHRDYGFVIGLVTGTFVGAGLAMWLVPRSASELRERMTESAKSLGKRASKQYQQDSIRVSETVDDSSRNVQGVYDDVAGAVASAAHEAERHAPAAKTDRAAESRKRSMKSMPHSL